MPADGTRDRHARIHQATSEEPQTVAMDDEPLDSKISETTRSV